MKLSNFGKKLTSHSGILQLMDDLGNAMSGKQKMLMLGGGNPAHIPEVEKIWRNRFQEILENNDQFERMLGNYTTPQGDGEFIEAFVDLLKKTYGWHITEKNIAVLNGSQTAFFFLFNMLAGEFAEGKKKILLPIAPEYIGYADQGISEDMFVAVKPIIEYIDEHTFKYKIDFDKLKITEDIAAICVSRPTNPTGNVITDEELDHLSAFAKQYNIPLILDNAYGSPFPNIIFSDVKMTWNEQIINVMSLSKIGLPSTRTAIVVANEEIIENLCRINAIASLSTGTVGQNVVLPLVKSGEIIEMSKKYITTFYQQKSEKAIKFFHAQMNNEVDYYLHKSEGALFLWLWCKDLPISSQELYERLKNRGVLVVPGHYFFPGLQEEWKHVNECIRITYSQKEEDVFKGLEIISQEVKRAYEKS
jgi:valine--pyruvate aminotransferase